jgi:glutamate formiminotransferase
VVDHVSLHALPPPAFADGNDEAHARAEASAAELARRLGASLAAPPTSLAVYFYGDARRSRAPLDHVRRSLGYFGAAGAGPPPPPDLGPAAKPRSGLACVGALPWVTNYNLALDWAGAGAGGREELHARARRVAAVVSQRRGGPPGCQSLALAHAGGAVEVACNLLSPTAPEPTQVRRLVEAAAATEGLRIVGDYCTGLSPAAVWEAAARADAD